MNQQIIAHRGASGYRPENTAIAMSLAHAQGADWLECDVVLTRDGEVLVLHDVELDLLTDVAARFPDRARSDGRYYVIDFSLEEIRTLRSGERRVLSTGQPAYAGRFEIPPEPQPLMTLEEFVQLVQQLNARANRQAGLCVELKQPLYHERAGVDLVAPTVEILTRHGFNTPEARCMLLSFEPTVLKQLRQERHWRGGLLQLIGPPEWGESDCDYARLLTPEGLAEIATYAEWVGAHLPHVVALAPGVPPRSTGFVEAAHACGLNVGSYTFQHEGLSSGLALGALLDFAFGPLDLNAVISDFPDEAVAALDRRQAG